MNKPHIRLVAARLLFRGAAIAEGSLWCLFSSRTSRTAIAMSRDREKLFRHAAQRARRYVQPKRLEVPK